MKIIFYWLILLFVMTNCSDKMMFQRSIKYYAKTYKKSFRYKPYHTQNVFYMYNRIKFDSLFKTSDSLYLKFNSRHDGLILSIFAKEWNYYYLTRNFRDSFEKEYESNFKTNRELNIMLNKVDSISLKTPDYIWAMGHINSTMLVLVTRNAKGVVKRKIINE